MSLGTFRYQKEAHACKRISTEPSASQGQPSYCHSHALLHPQLQNNCFLHSLDVILVQHFAVMQRQKIDTGISHNRPANPFPGTKPRYLTSWFSAREISLLPALYLTMKQLKTQENVGKRKHSSEFIMLSTVPNLRTAYRFKQAAV